MAIKMRELGKRWLVIETSGKHLDLFSGILELSPQLLRIVPGLQELSQLLDRLLATDRFCLPSAA
jgi:hypothetical protein